MEIDEQLLQHLLQVFRQESADHLQTLQHGIMQLERGEPVADAQLQDIFRAAHSIKGGARGIGLLPIVDVAHQLESVLAKVKQHTLLVTPEMVTLMLQALDVITAELQGEHDDVICDRVVGKIAALLQPQSMIDEPEPIIDEPAAASPEPTMVAPIGSDKKAINDNYTLQPQQTRLLQELTAQMLRHRGMEEQWLRHCNDMLFQFDDIEQTLRRGIQPQLFTNALQYEDVTAAMDQLTQLHQDVQQLFSNMRQQTRLFSRAVYQLDNLGVAIRLLPLEQLLRPLHRLVRDLATSLGKQIVLQVEGGEQLLDRNLYRRIYESLVQLLNNALDHGIESASKRRQLGKPPRSTITIAIRRKSEWQITITVSDDGKGIDTTAIAERAYTQGLLAKQETQLTDSQLLAILTTPGFSGRDSVSTVSGRGVGLDVVQDNLQAIGGGLSLQNREGAGCSFTLTVPLQLTTEYGIAFAVANCHYILSDRYIERLLLLPRSQISGRAGVLVIRYHDHNVELVDAGQLLQHQPVPQQEHVAVIICKIHDQLLALAVDRVIGGYDYLAKPFSYPIVRLRFCSSLAMVNGLGVTLLLDPLSLLQRGATPQPSIEPQTEVDKKRILVVDDSDTTRTLEVNILLQHGFDVVEAVNGKQGLDLVLRQHFDLIISDVEMPVMDGFSMIEALKQQPQCAKIPVIVVSALAQDEHKQRGLDLGVDAYITKDLFHSEKLLQAIYQLI